MKHTVDAKNRALGRLATEIAGLLQGKDSPKYDPRLASKASVEVLNASKIRFTGDKLNQRIYYNHTGYMGHLKERTMGHVFKDKPEVVLRKAVYNMLPKNKLRRVRLLNLHIKL